MGTLNGFVYVFFGAGDGSFMLARTLTTPRDNLKSIAVGDLTGDGRPDIVATGGGSSYVLFRGTSTGSFSQPQAVELGAYLYSSAVGHFDGDGILDVAMGSMATSDLGVYVFRGGPAGLVLTSKSPLNGYSAALSAGDVDGDGKQDLISNADGVAQLLFGRGDGTFAPAVQHTLGAEYGGYLVSIVDVNSDGRRDLVSTIRVPPTGGFSVVLNLGARALGQTMPGTIACGRGPLLVADWTRDSLPDVVCAARDLSLTVGNGDGTFRGWFPIAAPDIGAGANDYISSVAADLNHDGRVDIVQAGGHSLAVYRVQP
ncbi:MAG: VCBS repeat-containing protein [Myxococcaceae bacterium]|nr:VCBS repeat-containing protein [Myxococcaceae bacterium]